MFPKANKDFFIVIQILSKSIFDSIWGCERFVSQYSTNYSNSLPYFHSRQKLLSPDKCETHTPSVAQVVGSGCISREGRILITGPRKLRTGCVNVSVSSCHYRDKPDSRNNQNTEIKEVMNWEIYFSLSFWYIRSHQTIRIL